MIRRLFRTAAMAALMAAPAMAQAPPPFRARLAPVPLDVAMQATIAGTGEATASLAGTTLSVTGRFSGLKSAATVARVHLSPNRGIRGPAIGELSATAAAAGTLDGSLMLTPAQVQAFRAGRLYVQVHSEKAPDGNLWGWLLPATETRR
jgi:hypothetical protein